MNVQELEGFPKEQWAVSQLEQTWDSWTKFTKHENSHRSTTLQHAA